MKFRKVISILLALTIVFSLNIMSASQPELQKIFSNLFSVNAFAIDDLILKYAPEGTRDVALDASVTSSSYYSSGTGQWHLDRVNDGTMTYNGGENGYNGKAGYTSSTSEVYFHPDNMTEEEKLAAQAESKVKPWWMVFDLEGFYDISRVTLFKYGAFPDTFEVQVSNDGVNYTTVASESGHTGFNQEAFSMDFNARARYVRINVTLRGSLDGNYIHLIQFGEIGVYGTEVAASDDGLNINSYAPENCINLAPTSTVTATESYEQGDQWDLDNINDGDTAEGSGYTSESVNKYPLHIDYDLGNVAELKRLVFFPYGEFPNSFEIQTSYDGENYKTVQTVSGFTNYPGAPVVVELPEATFASYVRVNITARNPAGWDDSVFYVQFAEIGIYGIKSAYDAELNRSNVKLMPGDTLQLKFTVDKLNSFDTYNHEIEWKSFDENVVVVDSNGLVTAKAIGSTAVRVENKTIGYYAEVKVGVYEKLPYARDKMTVSIFSPPTGKLFTDEHYKRVAEADVDLLLNTYNVGTVEDNYKLLQLAEKYGMDAIVSDYRLSSNITEISKELFEEVYEEYKGISNLEGFYIYDEPWNANLYANTINNITSTVPGGFVYLNFFPGYIYNSYEQYEYTYDDWASLSNQKVDLMFDVYPFMYDGTTDYQRLFDSLNSIRRSGLKYDLSTAACVQTLGFGPANGNYTTRIPNEEDILYQNMAYLAYGIKHVSYWKYSSSEPNGVEKYTDCAIDMDGNPTAVYYHMQKANPIVHTLGETLINCDAKEVYISGSNVYGQSAVPANFFVHSADSSQSLILSYMADKNTGRNYLMVVNNDLANTVTAPLTFASGIDSVEILDNSTGDWSGSAINGDYSVTLVPGGAALIALPEDYRYEEAQPEQGTNPAYHKTVYGNSSLGTPGTRYDKLPGWYLSCLTDGYIEANAAKGLNGWCSELKDSSFETYVKIDLGNQQSMNTLTLYAVDESTGYNGYFPKAYTVSVSADGAVWTQVVSETNASVTDYVTYNFDSISARYIKVDITEMNEIDGMYAAAMAEIEINGKPTILRYKTIAEDTNGFYAYMYCENTDYIRVPTWTDYNDRDDIIWHDGESGSWTINGFKYNFRAYIPVSEHNNEYGSYTVHLYAYNSLDNTSLGTSFDFGSTILYDLNYSDVAPNLMKNLNSIKSENGITATYNSVDETVTLNGTLTASSVLQNYLPINAEIKNGDTVRVTIEPISGTATNPVIVMELFNDSLSYPAGVRHHTDIINGGEWNIPITSAKAASEISLYKFWIYKSDAVQSYDNYKFKIKLEVVSGDTVYSPAGKSIGYGEAYGTLPQPERSDADFLGWFTEPTGGTQITSSTVNYDISKITLYAHWQEKAAELYYGIYAGITAEALENDYLKFENATYKYVTVNQTKHLGTGTVVDAWDNETGELLARYSLVIFGDINGDSWYDGQDAVYVGAIANGMLNVSDLGEARMMAADCNHDGAVDILDANILNKAGLLLQEVDQNLPIEELETTSEWQEYISIIDQTPTEPEPEEPEEPEEKGLICRIIDFIIGFIKKVFSFIFD